MTGLIFATSREAAPFLARAGIAVPLRTDPEVARAPIGPELAVEGLRARAGASTATVTATFPCAERPGHLADAGQCSSNVLPSQIFYDLRPAHALAICIGGMGPARARAGAEQLLEKFGVTSMINAGAAGAVADCAVIGELYRVAAACLWPVVVTMYACRGDRWQDLPHVTLATVPEPVFDPVRRAEIERHADIVDMEGAAIAQCCQARGVPLYMIKGITDQAGPNDRARLLANLDAVSALLAERLWKELELE